MLPGGLLTVVFTAHPVAWAVRISGPTRGPRPGADPCAAWLMDGPIGAPARLEEQVNALLLVHGIAGGVVRPPGAAGVREDEDALAALHEGSRLGLAGPAGAGLQLLPTVSGRDQPLGPPGHLCHIVVAEVLEQPVERRHNGRQRAEMLDELGARGLGFGVVDGIARAVLHRHGALRSRVVGEHPHLPGREGTFEIVDHIFPRGQVDLESFALLV